MIRFWMNSTTESEPASKPFRDHKMEATRTRYAEAWTQVILFCLRTVDSRVSKVKIDYEPQTKRQLILLQQAFAHNHSNISELLLDVSVKLITHSDYNKEYSAIKYVSGVMGYSSSEGRWLLPQEYTPILARFLFCMQVIGLEHSVPTSQRNRFQITDNNTPESQLNQFRNHWLVENKATPFNYLHKMLNYGMTAAKDGYGSNWIRIDAFNENLFYKGERLNLAQLQEFQHYLLRKAEATLSLLLFCTSETVEDLNPYQFVHEDFSNTEAGYFFADVIKSWKDTNQAQLFEKLRSNTKRWNQLVNASEVGLDGGIVWVDKGIKEYEAFCKEFLSYLIVALNMQCGETGRGEEMVQVTFKNTMDGERNLKVESGQLVIETTYHKSQAIMGSLKVSLCLFTLLTLSPLLDTLMSG